MKQALFSLSLLLVLLISSLNSSATMAQEPASAPSPQAPDCCDSTLDDITRILEKEKTFIVLTMLLKTTEIMKSINKELIAAKSSNGLTILAPDDNAFSDIINSGFLNSLNTDQKIKLLQFHILPECVSTSSGFGSLSNSVETMAGKGTKRLLLRVTKHGKMISVNISTGVVNATVTGEVYSDNKVAIYRVDKVLIPLYSFVSSTVPASAPAPKSDKENTPAPEPINETNQDYYYTAGTVSSLITTHLGTITLVILWCLYLVPLHFNFEA